jgi:hypothetical protein
MMSQVMPNIGKMFERVLKWYVMSYRILNMNFPSQRSIL